MIYKNKSINSFIDPIANSLLITPKIYVSGGFFYNSFKCSCNSFAIYLDNVISIAFGINLSSVFKLSIKY